MQHKWSVRTVGTLTNDAAAVRIPTPQAGNLLLRVEHEGFAPFSRAELRFETVKSAISVTDSGTLLDGKRTGGVNFIGAELLRDRPSSAPGRGVLDLVRMQPARVGAPTSPATELHAKPAGAGISFMKQAAEGNPAGIQMGELAQQRGSSQAVRQYGAALSGSQIQAHRRELAHFQGEAQAGKDPNGARYAERSVRVLQKKGE